MRKEEGRGFINIDDYKDGAIESLYKSKRKDRLIASYSNFRKTTIKKSKKTKIGRKTTIWIIQVTNKGYYIWDDLHMVAK